MRLVALKTSVVVAVFAVFAVAVFVFAVVAALLAGLIDT